MFNILAVDYRRRWNHLPAAHGKTLFLNIIDITSDSYSRSDQVRESRGIGSVKMLGLLVCN